MTEAPTEPADETIDLKNPGLAAFLAWLVPGLGHLYQGRRAKAVLYFVSIMGLFACGIYLSSSNEKCQGTNGTIGYGRVVYFSTSLREARLVNEPCQLGIGAPSLVALLQWQRMRTHRRVFWNGLMAPPWPSDAAREAAATFAPADHNDPNIDQPSVGELHRQLHRYFELAGFFAMVAGLLNVLAIYDAWAGLVAMTGPTAKKEEEKAASA